MGSTISYVIGAYNEQDIIEQAIEECITVLSRDFCDYEIIVVDDCSKDNTGYLLDSIAMKHPQVRVIHNLINLNFGTSVLIGLFAAKNEYVFYNAADLPLDPANTLKILENMGDADVLVLERTSYASTAWRKITSKINQLLLYILFPIVTRGIPILNFTQVFRRDIIGKITPLARSPIFVWPEMVFRAKYQGLTVKNIKEAARVKNVRKGSFGKPHDIIWGLTDMLRFRLRAWGKKL